MSVTYNLSVIIPCFNVENYIARCMDSVINQSLSNIQIIIIDDASTDNTVSIVRQYMQVYENIELYQNTINKGTGEARNIGLQKVRAPLVCFLDADDWMDTNAYLALSLAIEKNNADIAVCGIKTEFDNSCLSEFRYKYLHENLIQGRFALKLLCKTEVQDIYISPIPNNKMFRSEFVFEKGLVFPALSFAEDDSFSFHSFYYAEKVIIVPDTFLHYYQREQSAMHIFTKDKIDNVLISFEEIRQTLQHDNTFETYSKEFFSFLDKCITSLMDMIFSFEQKTQIQKQYIEYLIEQLLKHYTLNELLEYLDLNRIKRFFI
ncbi:glycosyltransferase family 2 protein [Thomasclavelia spiroformis]|uniref:glycosyltransferase family 2 protein n=1 Tax=Thomasclavelia spiroformis TaxID=29348 RepID=UPI00399A9C9D